MLVVSRPWLLKKQQVIRWLKAIICYHVDVFVWQVLLLIAAIGIVD